MLSQITIPRFGPPFSFIGSGKRGQGEAFISLFWTLPSQRLGQRSKKPGEKYRGAAQRIKPLRHQMHFPFLSSSGGSSLSGRSRGQGEAFMILIGAVIGLLMLAIIIGIIAYFNKIECDSSLNSLYQRFDTAVQLPTGEKIEKKGLQFCSGFVFTRLAFAQRQGTIGSECMYIDASPSNAYDFEPGVALRLKQSLRLDVYFECGRPPYTNPAYGNELSSMPADCREACWIGFNKKNA
jgi:hypothetical protein